MEKTKKDIVLHGEKVPNHQLFEDEIRRIRNIEEPDPIREEIASGVAKIIGRIPTLERQYSDDLDFHDISVWRLKEMLGVSYELGRLSQELTPQTEEAL